MKCRTAAILVLLFLITAGTAPARAGQEITILRGQDFPPYHYCQSDGRETGFLIDLIRRAGQREHLSITFRQLPWSRCLNLVKTGQADAMMNLFKTQERMAFLAFSETPLALEVNRFFAIGKAPVSFTGDLAQLGAIKICAVRNYSYGKAFDEFAGRLRIARVETEKALLMNLISNRCDLILGNQEVIRVLARDLDGGSRIRPLGPGITETPLCIGFSRARGHEQLARRFSVALEAVKQSEEYRKILAGYGL